jgi:hypothetical protein
MAEKRKMRLARREWARQFYTAVARSFPKTIAEPVTNSDSSYKRNHGLPDANGLIEAALGFQKGQRFYLSGARKQLMGKTPERIIEIHVVTAKGHAKLPRTCEVVDFAEGLSKDDLGSAFEELAADKTGVSKGRPGRSLFGRGISDVLLGHKSGEFYSFKENRLSRAKLIFDFEKDEEPSIVLSSLKPNNVALGNLHLKKSSNGSCVRFSLHEDCTIPEEGTICQKLAHFYMLRLINSDPGVTVKLFQYRSGRRVIEDKLEYEFPIGDVIEKFNFEIEAPLQGIKLEPVKVEGLVCRADLKAKLPGRDAGELRANGFLIVDDKDAVLDLTLLPQYEAAPYLSEIFGVIRLTNAREVFSAYLNKGKDSPLTTTRDGFDTKHEFTQLLFKELARRLEPIYKKEEERFGKDERGEYSDEMKHQMNAAIKELNKFLKQLGEADGAEGETHHLPNPDLAIQFVPSTTKIVAGRPRDLLLYVRAEEVVQSGEIIFDSNNPAFRISSLSIKIKDGKREGDFLVYGLSVSCDSLHENGKIMALAEGKTTTLEACVQVEDVIAAPILDPPEKMEFRPLISRGQPGQQNSTFLYVNENVVTVGRRIKINVVSSQGTIGLLDQKKRVESTVVVFEKTHILKGTCIGRIPILWGGTGWGQSARLTAETKLHDGSIVHAEGQVIIEQPEEAGGLIREVKYRQLDQLKCSDFAMGTIYINSNHSMNNIVFGANREEYLKQIEIDKAAKYRLANIMVEQAVFRYIEDAHTRNKIALNPAAPVSSLRLQIDEKSHELGKKILKILISKKIAEIISKEKKAEESSAENRASLLSSEKG